MTNETPDRFKLYAGIAADVVLRLLGLTRKSVADRLKKSQANFNRDLLGGPGLKSLEEHFKSCVREQKQSPITRDSWQVEDAESILDGGLNRYIDMLCLLSSVQRPSAPVQHQQTYDITNPDEDRQKLSQVVLHSKIMEFQHVDEADVLELTRQVYPLLGRRDLGFAYQALGEAFLAIMGESAQSVEYATGLFERSAENKASELVDVYMQRIRCHVRELWIKPTGNEATAQMTSEIRKLASTMDVLSRLFPVPLYLLADHYKSMAEWLMESKREPKEVFQPEFERAGYFYLQAIAQDLGNAIANRTKLDLAFLYTNLGYCMFKADKMGDVESPISKAIGIYIKNNVPHEIAYNLKLLGHFYDAQNDGWWARWCSRAAATIFEQPNDLVRVADIRDARDFASLYEHKHGRLGSITLTTTDGVGLGQWYLDNRESRRRPYEQTDTSGSEAGA